MDGFESFAGRIRRFIRGEAHRCRSVHPLGFLRISSVNGTFPPDRGRHSFPRIKESWGEFSSCRECSSNRLLPPSPPLSTLPSKREYKKYREEQLRASTWQRDGSEKPSCACFSFSWKIGWNVGGGEKKQGRKRLAAKERAEVVLEREEEGKRGWRRREREENTERCLRGWSINIGSRGWNWGSRVGRVRGRTVVLLRLPPLSYGIRRMADITTWYRQWRIAHGP